MDFLKHIEKIKELENENHQAAEIRRAQELSGIKESNYHNRYLIKVTVENKTGKSLLLEYDQYKKFNSSTREFYKHPESTHPPVKAHFHVVDHKSRSEVYAVNMDGTAHHRVNKGYKVPDKEAKELGKLGVKFKPGNILESMDWGLNESIENDIFTFWFVIENE